MLRIKLTLDKVTGNRADTAAIFLTRSNDMTITHAARRVFCVIAVTVAVGLTIPAFAQIMLGPLPPIGSAPAPKGPPTAIPVDPPRWTQEDVTPEEKRITAQKEARAAYQVELDICNIMHPSERPACIAQARADFQQEMADINARFN